MILSMAVPFWIWNRQQHLELAKETDGQCCWNHIVGLPVKGKKEYPIFDYEKTLFNNLLFSIVNNPHDLKFKHKHLWVKKATGLGVTEFMLRLMAWLCTSTEDNRFRNSQMCIVTGPNIDLATKLIKRLKAIFSNKLGLYFTNKETALELNGCIIEAYPSNHIDSFRSLDNPKFILLDEADFFRKGEQEDVRHVRIFKSPLRFRNVFNEAIFVFLYVIHRCSKNLPILGHYESLTLQTPFK